MALPLLNNTCSLPVMISDLRRRLKGQPLQVLEFAKLRDSINGFIRSISDNQQEFEPFYILDLGVVMRLVEKWSRSLPEVVPFYAVKCNNEPALLAALATLGINFDCASRSEIETTLRLGVNPDRIVYANPCKTPSHIQYAASVGVNLATFDSEAEVDKMKKWHPTCRLLLRIKVNDQTSWRSMGNKFGAFCDEVKPLLQHAHQAGLKVVGVSFHVGSKASEARLYRDAILAARRVFDAASELKMPPLKILDIGGGFKDNALFDEIATIVKASLHQYFPDETSVQVISEPGRFFVETAFTMVTSVIGKRVREQIQYWIDDGIYGSFNLEAYDRSSMMMKPLRKNEDKAGGSVASSTIFGPSCYPTDIVASEWKLPEMEVDDLLIFFYNMGAYTTYPSSKFNGFTRFDMPTYLAFSPPS